MANKTIDINEATIKDYVDYLRPENPELREQLDVGYSYNGNIIILFVIRPSWNDKEKKEQFDFAKIRYYKSKKEWHLYWMRASGNWESYKPFPVSSHLARIIDVIKEDKQHCFFG